MKSKLLFALLIFIFVLQANSQSKTYFVSPEGNDEASGLSIKAAWKTIDRVNQTVFQPGDSLLFKAGSIWYGQLQPQGSGTPGNPIILSGYGSKERPVINLGKAEGAGIRLENQSWWIIDNMEVTSGVPPELGIGRQGIVAIARGENQNVENIVVRNCYIHDIWGQLGPNTEYTGYNSSAILVQIQNTRGSSSRGQTVNTTLNNVLIEHNRIEVRRSCLRSGYLDLTGGETWWPHMAAMLFVVLLSIITAKITPALC